MPRTCTICTHKQRQAIDRALIDGRPYRDIARQFHVSKASIERHKNAHLPATLARAHKAREIARADTLVGRIEALCASVERVLKLAETEHTHRGDLRVLAAVRESLETLGLLAKLSGELREGTTVNVLVAPEWVAVRQAVLDALGPFPEARGAVVQALRRANGSG
jgi:hypothetical protein